MLLNGSLHEPWLSADALNEAQLLLAPVHVLLLVFEVLLHHVEGDQVVLDAINALAQQLDAVDRHFVVSLEKLNGVVVEGLSLDSLLLEFSPQVEQTVDELVDESLLFLGVLQIFVF